MTRSGRFNLYVRGNEKSISKHSIVLDIDETLVHTFERLEDIKDVKLFEDPQYISIRKDIYVIDIYTEDRYTIKYKMWGIMRPKLREFLNFCFRYFQNVTIWTAGQRRYGNAVVSKIFSNRLPELVFTRDECPKTLSGGCVNKPLTYMIDKKDDMSLHHTFIVDDRIENFDPNPGNGILIPPFYPEKEDLLDIQDDAFDRLMGWFMKKEVIESEDVRLLDKTRIFR
jgi:hypothetical protein